MSVYIWKENIDMIEQLIVVIKTFGCTNLRAAEMVLFDTTTLGNIIEKELNDT